MRKFIQKHAILFSILLIIFLVAWGSWTFIMVPESGSRAIESPPATAPATPPLTN